MKKILNTDLTLKLWQWMLICFMTSPLVVNYIIGFIEGLLK